MYIFRSNLDLLASTPIQKLAAEGNRLRPLRQGEIADPAKLHKVIEDTFRYAANHEDTKHRLWTKIDEGHKYVSPGFLAKKLGVLPELNLPAKEEERHSINLVIGPHKIKVKVERETLAATSSEMFEHLLIGRFAEAQRDNIEIELPPSIDVSPDSIPIAINALINDRLPDNLDIDTSVDLSLLFYYFQANELFEASLAKTVAFRPRIADWKTLLHLPDEIVDGLMTEISQKDAEEIVEAAGYLSTEDAQAWGLIAEKNEAGKRRQVKRAGWPTPIQFVLSLVDKVRKNPVAEKSIWPISLRKFVIFLVNKADVPITDALLDCLGEDTHLLESANFSRYAGFLKLENILKRCPNLLKLQLSPFTEDDELKYLGLVPGLQSLSMSRCTRLKADALKHLERVPSLQSLNISYCSQLQEDALMQLGFTSRLQNLNIHGCNQLEADALKHLERVPSLQSLNISSCPQLQEDALMHLGFTPRLQNLNIHGCNQLEADALKHLERVPELQSLNMNKCNQLEADALKHLGFTPRLQSLNIADCGHLERDALKHLGLVPELQSLDIAKCNQLERDALKHLERVPRLQSLDISVCVLLEPDALKHLERVPNLQSLNISYCSQLQVDALEHLGFTPRLLSLDISHCPQLEVDGLKHLDKTNFLRVLTMRVTECDERYIPQSLQSTLRLVS